MLSGPMIFQPEEFKNAKDEMQQNPIEGVDKNFLNSEFLISSDKVQLF